MSPLLDEFFREQPRRARDLWHAGLALSGLGLFFKLMGLGVPSWQTLGVVLLCLGWGIGCMIGSEVVRRCRRRGLRATRGGLSEVFGPDRERFWAWEEIQGVEESCDESGVKFKVKAAAGEVNFDTSVEGWERLVARIRAEIAERRPQPSSSEGAAPPSEPWRPDLARLAPWLGDLPRRLGYPWSSYRKMVGAWVGSLIALLLMGLVARKAGAGFSGQFYSLLMIFAVFLGSGYGLRHAKKRAENAGIILADEGLTIVDEEGIERRFSWDELLYVQEVKRPFHASPVPSAQARRLLAPKAIQVRTPWGFFEIDKGLEEYERLLQLLQAIIASRERPPAYPAERQMASAAALSRARAPVSPIPTEASLSQAEKPPEEPPRLRQGVDEAADSEAVDVPVER